MEIHMADRASSTKSSALGFAALGETESKQFEAAFEAQKEFLSTFQELNRTWLGRVQLETTLASELVGKLTAARSVSDAVAVYQECTSRRMDMIADDCRRMLADHEKWIRAGSRLFPNGSPAQRRRIGE
jgi:hypothetical protein